MSDVKMDPSLTRLRENPEVSEDVQVVDFDTFAIIDAVITNVNEWGCKVTSEHVEDLFKNIGIRFSGARKLSKAQVTSVKGNDASVVFVTSESKVSDKRRETRNDVKIHVKIADLEGITEIEGTIVDAAKNGCKVKANGLTAFPEEVLLTMPKFNKPVVAEFAWRNDKSAGLRLLWDRTLEETDGLGTSDEGCAAPAETEDA